MHICFGYKTGTRRFVYIFCIHNNAPPSTIHNKTYNRYLFVKGECQINTYVFGSAESSLVVAIFVIVLTAWKRAVNFQS